MKRQSQRAGNSLALGFIVLVGFPLRCRRTAGVGPFQGVTRDGGFPYYLLSPKQFASEPVDRKETD